MTPSQPSIPSRRLNVRFPMRNPAVLLALAVVCAMPSLTRAAEFNIADGDVPGLIAAISAANAFGGVINLAPGGIYTLTAVHSDNSGLPPMQREITIHGNGATIQRSSARRTPRFRLLTVIRYGEVMVHNVTFANGSADLGGAIHTKEGSQLTLNGCSVLQNDGTVGGGIFNDGGAVTVIASTLSENVAFLGGAVSHDAGTLAASNATVSGNTAWTAGAIHAVGEVTLTQCTIAENLTGAYPPAAVVAGIDAHVLLRNCLIADNVAGDCLVDGGAVEDAGYNLIGDGSCITHPTSFSGDARLGPLADNGGPTLTHALRPGSPAVDAGDCAGGTVLVDQRGEPRPQGAACDIGAFEGVVPMRPGVEQAMIRLP